MKAPFSKYEILGRIVETVTQMPTDASKLALCNAIACSLWDYLQELEIPKPLIHSKPVVVTTTDIFDTEHTDDLPAEIRPKKTTVVKKTNVDISTKEEPDIKQSLDDVYFIPPLWAEKTIDLEKNYLGQYSNPCSTRLGKCRKPCVQTELWLFNKETDELTTCDVEYPDVETLHKSLDPYVEFAKKHRTPPQWLDEPINDAMDKLKEDAKIIVEHQKKNRMQQFVELYKMGFKSSQIAREMGITLQSVYSYKNQAKNKNLIA